MDPALPVGWVGVDRAGGPCCTLFPRVQAGGGGGWAGSPGTVHFSSCSPKSISNSVGTRLNSMPPPPRCRQFFPLLAWAHFKAREGGTGPRRHWFGACLCLFPAEDPGQNRPPQGPVFLSVKRGGGCSLREDGPEDNRTGSQGHRGQVVPSGSAGGPLCPVRAPGGLSRGCPRASGDEIQPSPAHAAHGGCAVVRGALCGCWEGCPERGTLEPGLFRMNKG